MKLPKSIIKKYGISKKAWSVFRGRKKTSVQTPMAKRRKARRTKARYFARKKSRSRRGSGSSVNLGGLLIGAVVYGAGRQAASNALMPLSSKLPFGDLSDEIALGTLGYFVAKGKIPLVNKIPYSKDIGKAALTIEAARAGAYVGQKYMPNVTNSSSQIYL